ncbi:IS5-like element ISCysp17 family transposase [Crocosphaera chwakensis]|uniref:Putative transposase n=1 Tax=Crocosphaera chwakensis CCY0110 TaxID=391612 RepID=A3INL4_9CHRO|nr:IS5-like element ISCysp17 family transposase [Crocosphaera chwakensis]EAZ90079.1 putative transposase [Crocosphaera chwakensis CCY0110]EAZ90688.1 putative transposase [Crocosphaera chwakensis CCY0110]EAZ91912.1 putative transposase [Crocosphaera chwakensis CCY0110]
MYRKKQHSPITPEKFELLPGTKLSLENRWVIMAELIPWDEFEEEYAKQFKIEKGAPAKPFRMALGALIIKEQLGISDRETVEQIRENPYLQYFIGLEAYTFEAPFEASMMVHFRQRINVEMVNKINEEMVKTGREKTEQKEEKSSSDSEEIGERENKGKLILDATCAPGDIKYPTDLEILNQGRKATEQIIDSLYKSIKRRLKKKPRTYRNIARIEYLRIAKKRRSTKKEGREAIRKQLKYIKKNLVSIEKLILEGATLDSLNKRQRNLLEVVKKVYEQQQQMWEKETQSVSQRIVSINQPHIRPIVRGKAGKPTEFGAKLSVSYVDNYIFLDRISWENFNESGDLQGQVEKFKQTYGCYPSSVHADRIYRSKANKDWCKQRGIRLSGIGLGRPPKNISQEEKRQTKIDEGFRNRIEGKFGQAKRKFSLDLVKTKLKETSETAIAITFLVINLSQLLRQLLLLLLSFSVTSKTLELNKQKMITKTDFLNSFIAVKVINLEANYWLLAA